MNLNELKEKISLAKKAVENEPEPFKTESFKIIFNKLMNSFEKSSDDISSTQFIENKTDDENDTNPMEIFSNETKLNKNDLLNVFDFKDNQFSLMNVKGDNIREQYFYSALMILAFWKIGKNNEFLSNVKLGEPMSKYGISTKNLSTELKKSKYREFIVIKGKGKSQEYRITTKGIKKAIEIITELV